MVLSMINMATEKSKRKGQRKISQLTHMFYEPAPGEGISEMTNANGNK